jgi:type I restriction enzyme, S subunit
MKRIGDVGVSLLDCDHRTPKGTDRGYPYLAIPNVIDGRLDLSSVRLISDEDYRSWTRRTKPQAGDVILTRRARVGDTAVIPEGLSCAIGQNLVILRSDGKQVDQSYLRWTLRGPLYEEQKQQFLNVGAVFDSLNCADIPKFVIPLPPLTIQHRIASILGALDDKIELNRQMNETLEAMARAIFKSWFVKVEHSEEDPAGDARSPVPFDLSVDIVSGGTPKTSVSDYWHGDVPWFSVADAPSPSDVFVLSTEKSITPKGIASSAAKVMPPLTTIISARGTVGECALTAVPMAMNQSCYGLRGRDGRGAYYTYFAARHVAAELRHSGHGSVFNTVTRDTFRSVRFPLPPVRETIEFDNQVESLMLRILSNLRESRLLKEVRDTLLPKLLSGEIRVGEAETLVESVV